MRVRVRMSESKCENENERESESGIEGERENTMTLLFLTWFAHEQRALVKVTACACFACSVCWFFSRLALFPETACAGLP